MKNKINTYIARLGFTLLFLFLFTTQLYPQKAPDISGLSFPEVELGIPSSLYQLNNDVSVKGISKTEAIKQRGMISNSKGEVNIIVKNTVGSKHFSEAGMPSEGASYDSYWRNLASIYIDPSEIISFSKSLPAGFIIKEVYPPALENEGPSHTKSDTYAAAGAGGEGLTIAVIDGGYSRYFDAFDAGELPVTALGWDLTGFGLFSGTEHGTACFETVFDHAADAQYLIFKIQNPVHTGQAVDTCIARGVNIITHSITYLNMGWDDDSGEACEVVSHATDNDILFFTAAGNYGNTHWKGQYNDQDNDDWHEWSDNDQSNGVWVSDNRQIRLALQWNTVPGVTNLNLFLTDIDSNILASSTSGGNTFESITWVNSSAADVAVYMWVSKASGDAEPNFQIYAKGVAGPFEHIITEGSVRSPANSLEPNCVTVGAVHIDNYETGVIENYSSQGPTNSGNIAPNVTGPTGSTTIAYGGEFSGTSCSTPNVAGTAACIWSDNLDLSPTAIRYLLLEQAEVYKDWGDNGYDNTFGRGGVEVLPFADNTLWVDRRYGNIFANNNAPYYKVEDAMNAVTSGGRLVFLGQNYSENFLFQKNVLIQSLKFNATIGN